MLLFKKKFLEAIRRGEKTQTIRLWLRPRLKTGQRSYIPGVGYIRIGSVEQVEIDELTDADARPDGFPTAEALRAEIHAIYSQYADRGQQAYRIKFTLAPNEVKASPRRDSKAIRQPKPVESSAPIAAAPTRSSLSRIMLPADGFLLSQSRRKSISP